MSSCTQAPLRVALAGTLALLAACGKAPHSNDAAGPSEARYRAHVERLSSDEFEGRGPGTAGEQKTIAYIEQEFRAAGLEPGMGDRYVQAVPVMEMRTKPDPTLQLSGTRGELALLNADDFVAWTRRPVPESRVTNAEVVFAGYGIVAPEYDWNDYAGVDVRGKLVLVLVNDPGFATQDPYLFTGTAMTYYGRWTYKFEEAVRQGAAGLLVIHETAPAGYPWEVPRNGAAQPQFDLKIDDPESQRLALEGWITHEAATRVLELAGESYPALKQAAARRGFQARPLGVSAALGVRNEIRERTSYNVVGLLRGRARPDEAFIYTAHWDHLGVGPGDGDTIFNGAADNATGVAALIELSRAFGATRPRPRRSVLFVAATLEESGLLGSEYFAAHPPLPVSQMAGGLNMDNLAPIGPARDVVVVGFGASDLDDYLRRAAEQRGRRLSPEPTPEKGLYYRSDHFNLAKHGVPMLYPKPGIDLVTGGAEAGLAWQEAFVTDRYHKPSDEYDAGWNVSGTLADLELYYDVGRAVANESGWPQWREDSEFRAIREASRESDSN
ncbi:MAG: M28 family metallopeptidase [Steroidobacteraceae bacterium]|nr:M28 family metallopeptidase [Steroidobacteraceae bacterium]